MITNDLTRCVHPVESDNLMNGAATAPVFPAISYRYLDGGQLNYPGFYSTYNQERLAGIIARLEGAAYGLIFGSGMAAITTSILSFLQSGDHIVFLRELYGGTLKFATDELPRRGISCSFATPDINSFQSLIQPRTRIIYIESPSNPLLNLVSLEQIVALARKHGIITIIDNTFASPINQRPVEAGFDISVESGTKYLGGHNDLPFGTLACNNKEYYEVILATAKLYGGSLTPQECYLAERSLKTLAIRVRQQNDNALAIALALQSEPGIGKVYYPGLDNHPQHALARQQMKGFGGMIALEVATDADGIRNFQQYLTLITPALSLGGVESLVSSPMLTSHRYLSPDERVKLGIQDNLLRLSVGIEDPDDILADIRQAIARLKR